MASDGFIANIKDKMVNKQDGNKSPPVPQQEPQKPKYKLGDEDDGLVLKLDLLRTLEEQSKP